MRMKFAIHEKQVKAKLGADYDLSKYTEGVDYKRQKTGFGSRVMFRAGLFDLGSDQVSSSGVIPQQVSKNILERRVFEPKEIAVSIVDPSLVEHKQDKTPILIKKTDLNLDKPVLMVRPASLDGSVRSAKVVKKHANQRYVETDTLGRVFVGEKGNQIKVSQIIKVKDGNLYLGR
jgi:hypothetical protein